MSHRYAFTHLATEIKGVVLKGMKYDPWIVTIWDKDHQLELGTDQLEIFLVVSALI